MLESNQEKYSMNFIVNVDFGPFNSIQNAANAEASVNWWDDNDQNQAYCTESFAALEVMQHLEKAGYIYCGDRSADGNGVPIGMEIYIGKSIIPVKQDELPQAGRDGAYKSFFVNGKWNIWIWGNDCFGALRASYAWLQSLGVSWFTPDDYGTIIPSIIYHKTEEIFLNYDFLTRGCYNEFIDDDNLNFLDWSSRNGMNMLRVQHYYNPHTVKKRGLQIMGGGHDIFYKYLNPNSIIENSCSNGGNCKTYFEAHPDWFALVNGVRSSRDENKQATEGYYTGDNICTSNEEGVAKLAENMLVSLNNGSYQYCDYLNLWAYDNGTWCSCNKCKKLGNLSRRMLMLAYEINKIFKNAYDTGKTHRRIKLVVPVYHETLEPPDQPLPDDFDYDFIISTFFPIERCYAHNINDDGCTETNKKLKDIYEKWTLKKTGNYKGNLFIGEYYNVSSFASLPFIFLKTIVNDLPYYYKTGTRHFYYMHISSKNWGMLLINNCIIAGFLKSNDFDSVKFLNEFYTNYYPKAGIQMRCFHEALIRLSANMKYLKHYQFSSDGNKLSLIGEIAKEEMFPLKHCKFDYTTDDYNNSISFTDTMKEFMVAERHLSLAEKISYGIELKRIEIEKMRFYYGKKVMEFIFQYVVLLKSIKADDGNQIYKNFQISEALRNELIKIKQPLEEMKYECPWYKNAYEATWHTKGYEKIRSELIIKYPI